LILVFLVPWFVPVGEPVLSTSYVLGFSNKAAVIGLVISIALFALLGTRRPVRDQHAPFLSIFKFNPARERLSRLVVAAWFLVALAISMFLWAMMRDGYGEAEYFLRRLREMSLGRTPYVDFEYAYGPLLIWAPFWLMKHTAPVIGDARNAYCLWHTLLSGLGILLLAWVVDRFDSRRRHKAILFSALAFIGLNECLGVNYVFTRFLPPLACLLLAHGTVMPWLNRRTSGLLRETMWVGFCVASFVVSASVSPEIGLACIPAFAAFSWFKADAGLKRKAAVSAAAVLGMTIAAAVFPFAYWAAVFHFGGGANTFPVLPGAHVLVYWAGILYVVPRLLQGGMPEETGETRGVIAGLAVLSIALIPGALVRCDSGHVFFYGLPVLIMASLLLARCSPRWFWYAAALAFLAFLVPKYMHFKSYYYPKVVRHLILSSESVRSVMISRNESLRTDIPRWQREASLDAARSDYAPLDKYGEMLVPFEGRPVLENYLRDRGMWRCEYFPDRLNLFFPEQVRRKVRDIEASQAILVKLYVLNRPLRWRQDDYNRMRRALSILLVFPSQWLRIRHEGYDPTRELAVFIRTNYSVVETVEGYAVLKRKAPETIDHGSGPRKP